MSAWIDVQTCWTRNYTVKGLVEAALTIGRTSDCMSVVFFLCVSTVRAHKRTHIHTDVPRFQGEGGAAADCQSLGHRC